MFFSWAENYGMNNSDGLASLRLAVTHLMNGAHLVCVCGRAKRMSCSRLAYPRLLTLHRRLVQYHHHLVHTPPVSSSSTPPSAFHRQAHSPARSVAGSVRGRHVRVCVHVDADARRVRDAGAARHRVLHVHDLRHDRLEPVLGARCAQWLCCIVLRGVVGLAVETRKCVCMRMSARLRAVVCVLTSSMHLHLRFSALGASCPTQVRDHPAGPARRVHRVHARACALLGAFCRRRRSCVVGMYASCCVFSVVVLCDVVCTRKLTLAFTASLSLPSTAIHFCFVHSFYCLAHTNPPEPGHDLLCLPRL